MKQKWNLILIIVDSLRKDHVGCYGNKWIKTTNIDRLAKESVMFTEAYPESLPTIPVRRATHTGNRVFPFREYKPRKGDFVIVRGWEPIPEEQVTLAEILQKEGYVTALITDTYHQFKPSMNFHRGFSEWRWIRGQEFDMYRSSQQIDIDVDRFLPKSPRAFFMRCLLVQYFANTKDRTSEEDWFAPKVFRAGMKWLEENRSCDRFFLCLDCFDPHEPWDPPDWCVDLYDPGYEGKELINPIYGKSDYLSKSELNHMRACYAGEVTMVDKWLGLFLEKVNELGFMDNSIVVLVSDHGHSLGEHGWTGKIPEALYPELIDIPFLIRHPEDKTHRKADGFVYDSDILPTLLSLLDVDMPTKVDGINLWPQISGERISDREYVTIGFANYVYATNRKYAYISRCDGSAPRLYDLTNDPEMNVNITDENPDIVDEMFKLILSDAGGSVPVPTYDSRKDEVKWYELTQK